MQKVQMGIYSDNFLLFGHTVCFLEATTIMNFFCILLDIVYAFLRI